MTCSTCNFSLPAAARFCPNCGAPSQQVLSHKIIDYRELINQSTQGFVGRRWLQDAVFDFLKGDDKRYFLLSGEPGLGKTAFLAHLVAQQGYVHHFISAHNLDWLSPVAFVKSIGAQLAKQHGAWVLAEEEVLPQIKVDMDIGTVAAGGTAIGVLIEQYVGLPVEELARKLILRPLRRLASKVQKPIVLIIDAVDEGTSYSGSPTIVDISMGLAATKMARILLTAHPSPALEELSFELSRAGLIHLELEGEQAENLADIRAYLEQAVAEPLVAQALQAAAVSAPEFVAQAVTRSEGNFLYLTSLLDTIRAPAGRLDLAALPTGLVGHYRNQVRLIKKEAGRRAWRRMYRPLLGVLTVARAPLTARQLTQLADIDRDDVDEVLETISLFLNKQQSPDGLPAYRWYHHAFARFLRSEKDNPNNWFDPQRYHAQIADQIHARYPEPSRINSEYALHNLAYHTRQAGSAYFPRLYALITPAVRRAKRERFGSDYVFSQELAEAMNAALSEEPASGLPQLVRCGLINATLNSVADIPAELLRELARLGQWHRALTLAHAAASRKGPSLQAIVEGLLMAKTPPNLDFVQQIARQIPNQSDDAMNRAESLAQIASVLAESEPDKATALFEEAQRCAEVIPGPDDQARTLARIARLRTPSEPEQARQTFDAALTVARNMSVRVDSATRNFAIGSGLVTQLTHEANWVLYHTPIDTWGAKARTLADVAAELARAGDSRADDIFREALEVAAEIGAGHFWWYEQDAISSISQGVRFFDSPDKHLQEEQQSKKKHLRSEAVAFTELFADRTLKYIAARRQALSEPPVISPDPAALDAQLQQALERVPTDTEGYVAMALIQLAQVLLTNQAITQAHTVVKRAVMAAEDVKGGFRAKILADAAALAHQAGDETMATQLANLAAHIARGDADLLTSFRAGLATMGYEWAATLRAGAKFRNLVMIRRYYSDSALSQMAQSIVKQHDELEQSELAPTLSEDERDCNRNVRVDLAFTLIKDIRDVYQRARAYAALVGYLAKRQHRDVEYALKQMGKTIQRFPTEQRDYLLVGCIELLAPQHPPTAEILSRIIETPKYKAAALTKIAAALTALGTPATEMWNQAWNVAQKATEKKATIALTMAGIAAYWGKVGDLRATNAFNLALKVARAELTALDRVDALTQIAKAMNPFQPEQAKSILNEATEDTKHLDSVRARGRALSHIAGAYMELAPKRACALLADLSKLGRSNFLDGVAQIVPAAAQLGGTALIWQLFEALEEAERFFERSPMCGTAIQSIIDYSELITERTQDFTGREWLFHQIGEWLVHGSEPVFLLTSGPGSGKTAAAARLVQMSEGQVPATDYPYLGQGSLTFFHFCQALDDRTLNPRRFVEGLSLALAHRYPLFAQALIQTPDTSIVIQQKVGSVQSGGQVIGASIESLHIGTLSARVAFDRIVRRPLEQLCTANFDETILILVDALDEALTYPDETLLSRATGLPPQVRFVLTSRPSKRVLDVLGKPTLDLIDDAPDNQDDVVAYAHRRLHTLAEPKRMQLARHIATAGAGNFLYARYVLDDLLADEKRDLEPATLSLPAGLDDIYRQFLQRQFPATSSDWKKHYRPLLGMLAVARGSGLTRSQLGGIMSIAHQLPQSQTDDFLQACAQYLSAPHPDGPFRIYHHSFRDFLLTDERYQIYPAEANQAIADFFAREYSDDWLICDDEYGLRYLPSHLADSVSGNHSQTLSMLRALTDLLTDLDFLEAKTAQVGVDALLSDMHAALRVLTEPSPFGYRRRSGNRSIKAKLKSKVDPIHRALDLESHYLRRWKWREDPAFFAQQMLNRITELGWGSKRHGPRATARQRLIQLEQPYLALRWRARQESPVLIRTLTGHTEAVHDVKITPDSRLAISASSDGTVKVWNLQTGQSVRTLTGHQGAVMSVAISHDGRYAASACENGTLRLWDLQSWQLIHVIDGLLRWQKNPIAITPDDYVIATCNDGTVRVWHLHTGQQMGTLANHRGSLTAIALSPDGPIISSDTDLWTATLSIWDKQTRRFIDAVGHHEGPIRALAVIPDDKLIVSASEDGTLKIWDQKTGIEVRTIRVWEPSESGQHLRGIEDNRVHVATVTPSGRHIISASWERTLSVWDTHTGQLIDSLTGHEGAINAVAATPDGHLVLSASDDKTLKLWNLRELIPNRQRLAGHTQWVNAITVSPDGSHIISGSDDGTIKVWQRSTGKELHTFIAHSGWVLGLACTPSGRYLISASADRTLKIWDIETFQLVRTLIGHEDRVIGVAVTPNGHLISASADHTLKVWDLQTGAERRTLVGHQGSVNAVAVTNDGQVAISASWDHTLKMWNLQTGQEVCTLYGHKDRVDGVAITPDNRLAISASYDYTLIIWNLQTGQAIRTLTGHTDAVYKVAVTPDGQRALSVSGDHTLRVWDLQTGRQLAKVALEGALGSITVVPEPLEIVVGDAIGNLYCLSYIETPGGNGKGKQMNGPYL